MNKITKYKKSNSIINNSPDEYTLSQEEYYILYTFFVTYSTCENQSSKKRTFFDYGWAGESIVKSGLKAELETVLPLDGNAHFVFEDTPNLETQFEEHDLQNGKLRFIEEERAVLTKTHGSNKYLKLFYRIRNGLAHGSFALRLNSLAERMIIIQDQDHYCVTARIVLKIDTLLKLIQIIDRNGLIVGPSARKTEEGAA